MFKVIAMGVAAAAVGIGAGLYLKKKKDEKDAADIISQEELDRIAAECSPFNDEKWAAEFQENLQKCADENMAKLHVAMEKLFHGIKNKGG